MGGEGQGWGGGARGPEWVGGCRPSPTQARARLWTRRLPGWPWRGVTVSCHRVRVCARALAWVHWARLPAPLPWLESRTPGVMARHWAEHGWVHLHQLHGVHWAVHVCTRVHACLSRVGVWKQSASTHPGALQLLCPCPSSFSPPTRPVSLACGCGAGLVPGPLYLELTAVRRVKPGKAKAPGPGPSALGRAEPCQVGQPGSLGHPACRTCPLPHSPPDPPGAPCPPLAMLRFVL